MYYLVYGFLWLVSKLPFRVLYFISDCIYGLVYYVLKYRRPIVMDNLSKAFPEKSKEEISRIARSFYHNLIDTFIESIKFISISKRELEKRSTAEYKIINELVAKGNNVHVLAGHQFNWEFANLLYSLHVAIPFAGIYMPISNKNIDKIFYNIRGRYGTVLIPATDFRNKMHSVFNKQYVLAMAADQNPGYPGNAYWMRFMGRPAPFVTGPAKGAVKNNTAVVYVKFKKIKRGYYSFHEILLAEDGAKHTPQELTMLYRDAVQQTVKEDPANYLWSHRRWKYEWKAEYGPMLD